MAGLSVLAALPLPAVLPLLAVLPVSSARAAVGYPGVLENDIPPTVGGDVEVGGAAVASPGDWSGQGPCDGRLVLHFRGQFNSVTREQENYGGVIDPSVVRDGTTGQLYLSGQSSTAPSGSPSCRPTASRSAPRYTR
jgi:hypothetical protein